MLSPVAGLVVNNKYILEGPLARGGMGSVWTATHRELGVRVAVKFMDPAVANVAGGSSRFEREAKAAAQLESRHVVQVRDYGVAEGSPYLVMELLKGESLEQRLWRQRRLSIQETLVLLRQLSKGLRQAHEAGIVHRDLKPGNIFLARVDDEDVVKILDFGIAKIVRQGTDAHATRTGMVMGSVHYASPEQLRSSKDADARSDVWSVAVILFRMLVGDLPFRGSEVADVIVKVCAEPIPRPCAMAPDLPAAVDQFFSRALIRNPAERFQTITQLLEAFEVLASNSITEGPSRALSAEAGAQALRQPGPPRAQQVPTEPLPVADSEVQTALWSPAPKKDHPVTSVAAPLLVDTTLHGPGTSSNTQGGHPQKRRGAAPKIAAGFFVAAVACTIVFLLIGRQAEHPRDETSPISGGKTALTSSGMTGMVSSSPGMPLGEPTSSSTAAVSGTVPTSTAALGGSAGSAATSLPATKPTATLLTPPTRQAPKGTQPSVSPKPRVPANGDKDVDMP